MKRILFSLFLLTAPLNAAELQLDHSFGPNISSQVLAFSPDAQKLAVAGSDGIKIYETSTGRVLETREGSHFETASVAWSPDGKALAAGSLIFAEKQRGEIFLWREGQTLHWLTGQALVASLAWSPDSKTLASASASDLNGEPTVGSARLWDAATGQLKSTLGHYFSNNAAIAFSGDGKKVVFSNSNGRLEKYETVSCNAETGRVLKKWSDAALPLLLNGDKPILKGDPLARSLQNGVEWRVDAMNGADHMRYRFAAHKVGAKSEITSVDLGIGASCATFGGDYLATLMLTNYFPGYESSVAVWKIEGSPPRAKLLHTLGKRTVSPQRLFIASGSRALVFSSNRGTALIGSQLQSVGLLPYATGQSLFDEVFPSLSSDGTVLFDGRLMNLWSSTGRKSGLASFQKLEDFRFGQTMLSPDGQVLAGQGGVMDVAAFKNGRKKVTQFSLPDEGKARELQFQSALWSPDSARIAIIGTANKDDRLFLFARNGRFEREIKAGNESLRFSAAAFSPDGKRLLTDGKGGSMARKGFFVNIWDTASGARLHQFEIPPRKQIGLGKEKRASVAYAPDGRSIAVEGTIFENGIWSPRLLFLDAESGAKSSSLPLSLKSEKSWVFLDHRRVAILNGNALEIWDFCTHLREKSLFLVPNRKKIGIVERF